MKSRQGVVGGTAQALVPVLIAVLCAGALVLIGLIVSGSSVSETSGKAIATAVALAFFSLTAVAGTNLALRRPPLAGVGYLTAAVSLIAFLAFTVSLWADLGNGEPAAYTLLLAFASAHTSVLLAAGRDPHRSPVRLVRIGTLVALWALVVIAIVDIAGQDGGAPIGVEPIAVIAVLYGLGTIVLLLLGSAGRARSGAIEEPHSINDRGPGVRLDHLVIGISDWERSNAFYSDVLGAKVLTMPGGRFTYRIGDQQLNPHGPGTEATPLAADPVRPGNSDLCFSWGGTANGALDHLQRHGVEVVMGPVQRIGAQGEGESIYFRDPDGSLIELIAYG